jgi:hypothetical protein
MYRPVIWALSADRLSAKLDQSSILMIETGQRSTASRAHASSSLVIEPSAMLPLSRNFLIIWLKVSSGFSSNNPGQVSEHVPQLVQFARSIITFIKKLDYPYRNKDNPGIPRTTYRRDFLSGPMGVIKKLVLWCFFYRSKKKNYHEQKMKRYKEFKINNMVEGHG